MGDPISDMLNRLMNAQTVQKESAEVPFSQIKYAIAQILAKRGFIKNVDLKGRHTRKILEIGLQYQNGSPQILGVKRISKPGARMYRKASELRRVRNGLGMAIISTSKGLMTDQEARRDRVGGEVLCEIW